MSGVVGCVRVFGVWCVRVRVCVFGAGWGGGGVGVTISLTWLEPAQPDP